MAESILVTGKKISTMELVTNVVGNEKIPTGQPDDLALTPNQIADHTIARGDLTSQEDLSQVEVSLGTQITDLAGDVNASNNSIRGLIAAEEAARIAKDLELQEGLSDLVRGISEISGNLSSTVQTFNTPEAGVDPVTGVADGAYFNVRSASDESYVDEYRNVGGSAVATGKRYLSALGVAQQEKPADTIIDESGLSQQIYNRMIKNAILTKKNLRDLGFKGDGSDESTLLQTVFDSIGGVDLDFGGLTVSVAKQVNLVNKERFKLRNGEIRATDNFKSDTHVQPVVNISRSSHWSIYDFDFDGNRFNRMQPSGPTEPVWHSLQIYGGCKNFYMQNVNLKDGMMENLYICGGTQPNWDDIPTGGTFINVNCDQGYRNSSAIIHGIDLTFIGCSFTGSYGNPAGPCAGMDIESNNDGGALSNIQFIACTFKDNQTSQVQVSGKDYIRSIRFLGGTIDGGIYPDSSPVVWYSSAAIFDGVTIRNFNKTTGDQVIRIPSSGVAGRYPDQYFMRSCTLENITTTKPFFYVHSHAGGLNLEGNTFRDIECQTIGHIFGGNNNISKNVFDGVVGKNWLYDYVDSGNEPINIFKDNVFKGVTGELRLSRATFTGNTFINCGTGSDVTYVARVTGQTSIADNNTFISTTLESAKKALVTVDVLSASYNKTYLYDDAYDISNTNESVFKTVQQSNQKDNVLSKTDSMIALGTIDLNTLYHHNAVYFQLVAVNATLARNYPISGFYGKIEVIDTASSGDYVYCTQIATMAGSKQQWIRRGSKFGSGNINWLTWDLILNSSFNGRGASSSRPTTNLFNGRMYLDITLATAGKPIWYSDGQWVDATGSVV